MKEILNRLFSHENLSRDEAKNILVDIASARYPAGQVASFLTVFRMRAITGSELEGFRDAMLELCLPVNLADYQAIDVCGTGGDGKNTFNVSTLSAFVIAGAGIKVTKHGNYGVSSICGSSNVLENVGVEFAKDEAGLKKQLDKAGICFLHAPFFHPAMKHVAPIRKELGVSTFFNMLGPIVNPAKPKKQLIGVYNLELARLYSYVLQRSHDSYAIIHSLDGYDEISLTSAFKLISKNEERVIEPEELSLPRVAAEDILGGDSVEYAGKIFMNILNGEGTEAQSSVVIANAGVAIRVATGKELGESIELARESLLGKKALAVLKQVKS